MSKLKIETFIGEEDITAPVYKIDSFPITNPLAVEMAQKILEENEGDYLCGFVSLIYNEMVRDGDFWRRANNGKFIRNVE